MLRRPLERIFAPIQSNIVSILFHGDHTKNKKDSVPGAIKGNLLHFGMKKMEVCLCCKEQLPPGGTTPCTKCQMDGSWVMKYMQYLNEMKTAEMEFGRLWTQCQACQGSFHQEVICKARDCDIFYVRTRAKMDLEESRGNVEKFKRGQADDYGW